MYNWKPKKDGTDVVLQYINHQNDFFHTLNLSLIRTRKNKFICPKLPLRAKPNKNLISLKKEYERERDNEFLASKLKEIGTRQRQPLNTYFLSMEKKRVKFNQAVRKLEIDCIKKENLKYKERILKTQGSIKPKQYEKEYEIQRMATSHIKKIQPLETCW